MAIIKSSILTVLLTLSGQCFALNLLETGQTIDNSLYDNRTCNDLYMQASALEQKTFLYKTTASNNTRAATYALTVFSPAIYYFGFTAYKNHVEQSSSQKATDEIVLVRLRMAEKRCFEKN